MNEAIRKEILSLSKMAHDLTETEYQKDPSIRGESGWPEKQRILLADMALHLLQTALRDGELSEENLKRNLFSILTISDQFLADCELKNAAKKL